MALFEKTSLSGTNEVLVDKLGVVCNELDQVIHSIVRKTYELEEGEE